MQTLSNRRIKADQDKPCPIGELKQISLSRHVNHVDIKGHLEMYKLFHIIHEVCIKVHCSQTCLKGHTVFNKKFFHKKIYLKNDDC